MVCLFIVTSGFWVRGMTTTTQRLCLGTQAIHHEGGPLHLQSQEAVDAALSVLSAYDDAYLARQKAGRAQGKSPFSVEFERAQQLKAEGLQLEREQLRQATKTITSVAEQTTLGIKAESGIQALDVLRGWVGGLLLQRGVLRAVDENNVEVEINRWDNAPVYIKYNSSEGGDAYMKPYEGGYSGVIFQPVLHDGVFRQYGDLPAGLYA